ncbi:MAG: amidase family protein, partial [Pseudomonadota bacterium]
KPGLGRVPVWNGSQKSERGLLAQLMSVQGLLVRQASDLHLSMPVMIAPDAHDPYHVPLPWRGAELPGPIRVAVTRDDLGFGLDPQVAQALDLAAAALDGAGYAVEDAAPPLAREIGDVGYRALMTEVKAMLGEDIRRYASETLNAIFDQYYENFPPYSEREYLEVLAKRTHYARLWSLFLAEYPLVLTPFMLKPFFSPGRDAEGAEGVMEALGGAHWSFIMNFLGLPAGNLPTYLAQMEHGPQPIGVQLVGQRWREDLIVDAMAAIETTIPPLCTTLWAQMA